MPHEGPRDSNEAGLASPGVEHSQLKESVPVILRLVARAVILGIFAAFGSHGFANILASLFALAALYCVIAASVRHEAPLGPILTHFDEAAAYALCASAVSWAV